MHPGIKILCLLALLPSAAFVGGWTLQTLWLWFVVPLGAVPIGLWHAAGLHLFASWLATRPNVALKPDYGVTDAVGHVLLAPLFVLAVAWLFRLGM